MDRSTPLKSTARAEPSQAMPFNIEQILWAQDALGLVIWLWETERDDPQWLGDLAPLLGLPAGSFVGGFKQYLARLHPDDRAGARQSLIDCLKQIRPEYRREDRVVWNDGSIRWIETYGRADFNVDGRASRLVGFLKDVTERKLMELSLARSEERFGEVFRASPVAILVTRLAEGRILSVNPAFEEITGYAQAEAVGRSVAQLALWAYDEESEAWRKQINEQGVVRDAAMHFRTKDGRIASLRVSSSRAEIDGLPGVISLARDITSQEAAEKRLIASERKYAAVFDTSPEPIAITRRADLVFLEVNVALLRQLGRVRDQTLGHSLIDLGLWADPGDQNRLLAQLEREGRVSNFEAQFQHSDRSSRDVLVSACPLEVNGQACIAWAWRDITEHRRAERARAQIERLHREELTRIANQDPLTGLPNRTWLIEHLRSLVQGAAPATFQFGVLFVDFDGFKRINDTIGHALGDELLRAAALRLRQTLRAQDHVARMGGDEFAILMSPILNRAEVERLARRLVDVFALPFALSTREVRIGISIGISLFPADAQGAEQLLRAADIAMYEAKSGGRGGYHFYTDQLDERVRTRVASEQELANALEHDELVLHYQPRVRGSDGRLVGFEVLLRWRHARRGLLTPADFLPLALECGLIMRMGERVIELVCEQLVSWRMQRVPLVPVSINLTAREFQRDDLPRFISGVLARHALSPDLLQIEISEAATADGRINVGERLSEISGLGLKILIDDFGSGYSSLAQLQTLDVDVLKIDPVFVRKLGTTRQSELFVRTLINMASALNMTAVAEGVETQAQLDTLRRLRCDQIQGYVISRPVGADAVPELLARSTLLPEAT
jgi:diguanylate cyclase (GGDEF)-like protein/PAS domain S-box-containing protein